MSQSKVAIVSSKTASDIVSAFRTLHAILLSHNNDNKVAPTFSAEWDKCGFEDYKLITQASRQVLALKVEQDREARFAPYRAAIKDATNMYMVGARKAKSAFDALPAEVKAFIPAFSSNVDVPLTSFSSVWGKADENTIVKELSDMGYKVGKSDKGSFIRIPFTAEEQAQNVIKAA